MGCNLVDIIRFSGEQTLDDWVELRKKKYLKWCRVKGIEPQSRRCKFRLLTPQRRGKYIKTGDPKRSQFTFIFSI